MKRPFTYKIFMFCFFLTSCGIKQTDAPSEQEISTKSESVTVTTKTISPVVFTYDLVSNGRIVSSEYVDLRFGTAGAIIERILVKNGQHVSKGQILAVLDRFKLDNAVSSARNTLERSRLDLADALIGQGYDPENMSAIPDDVMRLARLRSGVAQAEVQLRDAEHALEEGTLKAPFAGIVANLTQKAGNVTDGSQPFCRVMSTASMEVKFPILETELGLVKVGDAVEVKPFSSETIFAGKVSSINPIVNSNGMVDVYASVSNPSGLYDGMNVRVNIKREIEQALVVPKSAVVLRSNGRQVVFSYSNGKAVWNYVTTGLENMNEYVITEGLSEGQEVIISGNINLAHETPVKVKND